MNKKKEALMSYISNALDEIIRESFECGVEKGRRDAEESIKSRLLDAIVGKDAPKISPAQPKEALTIEANIPAQPEQSVNVQNKVYVSARPVKINVDGRDETRGHPCYIWFNSNRLYAKITNSAKHNAPVSFDCPYTIDNHLVMNDKEIKSNVDWSKRNEDNIADCAVELMLYMHRGKVSKRGRVPSDKQLKREGIDLEACVKCIKESIKRYYNGK